MIKIMITDDHPMMIDGVKTALANNPNIEIIGEALSGYALLDLLKTRKPDIILLDISMPGIDGMQVAEKIKHCYKDLKIIMLTQFSYRRFVKKCQEIGVDGYLLKDCGKTELIEAISIVSSGGIYFKLNDKNKFIETYLVSNDTPILSCREKEVLILLAKDKSISEIASQLRIGHSSIKTYQFRLKTKSGTKNIAGLISWAFQNNIIK